jgi:predicted metal-dependent hydrolase
MKRSTPARRIVATAARGYHSVSVETTWRPGNSARCRSESDLARGLDLARAGEYFAAHEALEDAWRAADPAEKDFFQGLVHVVVAWYQAGRGNKTGCERQLEKAARRLTPFSPVHRGVDVAALLSQVEAAQALGTLELRPLDVA